MPSLYEQIKKNFLSYPNKPAIDSLVRDRISTITYGQMQKEINLIARAMVKAGVQKGDRVLLLSENRFEWYIAAYSVFLIGGVAVPLYTTASEEQHQYITKDCGANFAFISKHTLYKNIETIAESEFLKTVIFDFDDECSKSASSNLVGWTSFRETAIEMTEIGDELLPNEEDTAVLIYTSGTTGEPKGVMLSHANIIANIDKLVTVIQTLSQLRYLSLLPLSHAYEFTVINVVFSEGGTVIPVSNMGKVMDYISKTSPSIACAVPRLFEKIYNNVTRNVEKSSPTVRWMFDRGMILGNEIYRYIEKNEPIPFPYNIKYKIYDKLVFEKIRNKTVKTIQLFISGGAAIMPEIIRFFNILGTTIIEGYGITECSPVVSANLPTDRDVETVGKPLAGLKVKILKDGELVVKGPTVMKGYYNKETETNEVIDENGYFHTGDLAVWTDNGKLKIIGRKKEIIVMASGKNIAPQKIENILMADPYIDSACIVGDEQKFLAAIIAPDLDALKTYAQEKEYHYTNEEDLIKHPSIIKLFERKVAKTNSQIESYEAVKKFKIVADRWSVETGELTPTLKIKRKEVKARYKSLIDSFFING